MKKFIKSGKNYRIKREKSNRVYWTSLAPTTIYASALAEVARNFWKDKLIYIYIYKEYSIRNEIMGKDDEKLNIRFHGSFWYTKISDENLKAAFPKLGISKCLAF